MLKRLRAYFGLDGSTRRPGVIELVVTVLPPLLVEALLASVDGVHGVAGGCLSVVYLVAALAVWLLVLARFAPWMRR